jgi:hypothetical protein
MHVCREQLLRLQGSRWQGGEAKEGKRYKTGERAGMGGTLLAAFRQRYTGITPVCDGIHAYR